MEKNIIIGIANPKGEKNKSHGTFRTEAELHAIAKLCRGKPVFIEHIKQNKNGEKIAPSGVVLSGRVLDSGKLSLMLHLYDTPNGKLAKQLVHSGKLKELSLGGETLNKWEDDKLGGKIPVAFARTMDEVSLVHKGDRQGAKILKIMSMGDLVKESSEKVYNENNTNHNTKKIKMDPLFPVNKIPNAIAPDAMGSNFFRELQMLQGKLQSVPQVPSAAAPVSAVPIQASSSMTILQGDLNQMAAQGEALVGMMNGNVAPAVTAPAIPELPPPPVAATTPETETAPKNIEVPSISLDLRKHPLNAPQVPDPLPLNEEQLKDLPPEVREQILLSHRMSIQLAREARERQLNDAQKQRQQVEVLLNKTIPELLKTVDGNFDIKNYVNELEREYAQKTDQNFENAIQSVKIMASSAKATNDAINARNTVQQEYYNKMHEYRDIAKTNKELLESAMKKNAELQAQLQKQGMAKFSAPNERVNISSTAIEASGNKRANYGYNNTTITDSASNSIPLDSEGYPDLPNLQAYVAFQSSLKSNDSRMGLQWHYDTAKMHGELWNAYSSQDPDNIKLTDFHSYRKAANEYLNNKTTNPFR